MKKTNRAIAGINREPNRRPGTVATGPARPEAAKRRAFRPRTSGAGPESATPRVRIPKVAGTGSAIIGKVPEMEKVKTPTEVASPDEVAIEVIEETISLMSHPRRWVRGVEATDGLGRSCKAGTPEARCFCLDAAMRRTAGTTGTDEEGDRTPGLRDVHDTIERRLWREGQTVRYDPTKPRSLVIAWNDEPERCELGDVHEVLADAATAIRIRGRALADGDKPQTPLRSTGNKDLDQALWGLVGTLSDEADGNSELIDAGENVLRAWEHWQGDFV